MRLSADWGMTTAKESIDVKKKLNTAQKVRLNYRDRKLEEDLKGLIA